MSSEIKAATLLQQLVQTPTGRETFKTEFGHYRRALINTQKILDLMSQGVAKVYNIATKQFENLSIDIQLPKEIQHQTQRTQDIDQARKHELIERVNKLTKAIWPDAAEEVKSYMFSKALQGQSFEKFLTDATTSEIMNAEAEVLKFLENLQEQPKIQEPPQETPSEYLRKKINQEQQQLNENQEKLLTFENNSPWPAEEEIGNFLQELQNKKFGDVENEAIRANLVRALKVLKEKNKDKLSLAILFTLNSQRLINIMEQDKVEKLKSMHVKLNEYLKALKATKQHETEIKRLQGLLEKENPIQVREENPNPIQPIAMLTENETKEPIEQPIDKEPKPVINVIVPEQPIPIQQPIEPVQQLDNKDPEPPVSVIVPEQPIPPAQQLTASQEEPVIASAVKETIVDNPPPMLETPKILPEQLQQNNTPERPKKVTGLGRLLEIFSFPFIKIKDFFVWIVKRIFK